MDRVELIALMAASIYGPLVKDHYAGGELHADREVIEDARKLAISEAEALFVIVAS